MKLEWREGQGGPQAQIGRAISSVINLTNGYNAQGGIAARLVVRGPRGGRRRLGLGNFATVDEARRACERHWKAGCDVSGAVRG
jgi:hypothetical protein